MMRSRVLLVVESKSVPIFGDKAETASAVRSIPREDSIFRLGILSRFSHADQQAAARRPGVRRLPIASPRRIGDAVSL